MLVDSRMDRQILFIGVIWTMLLASCSSPPSSPVRPAAPAERGTAESREPVIPPLTLDGYKKAFALRVAHASKDMFDDPLPEIFRSIVVLDVTVGRDGSLGRVTVRRSNGYKALENRAIESVRRAAPFAAPAFSVRGHDGTVNFLETFLFRDDGRFQIRSLVAAD